MLNKVSDFILALFSLLNMNLKGNAIQNAKQLSALVKRWDYYSYLPTGLILLFIVYLYCWAVIAIRLFYNIARLCMISLTFFLPCNWILLGCRRSWVTLILMSLNTYTRKSHRLIRWRICFVISLVKHALPSRHQFLRWLHFDAQANHFVHCILLSGGPFFFTLLLHAFLNLFSCIWKYFKNHVESSVESLIFTNSKEKYTENELSRIGRENSKYASND